MTDALDCVRLVFWTLMALLSWAHFFAVLAL
jgi:hypothetical protein